MSFNLRMDLSKSGIHMFFKPYMIKSLEILWGHPEGLNTRSVWMYCNEAMNRSISRASIINFLAWAADLGILEFNLTTGKGGYHRIYTHKYSEEQLSEFLRFKVYNALQTL